MIVPAVMIAKSVSMNGSASILKSSIMQAMLPVISVVANIAFCTGFFSTLRFILFPFFLYRSEELLERFLQSLSSFVVRRLVGDLYGHVFELVDHLLFNLFEHLDQKNKPSVHCRRSVKCFALY